MFNNIWQSILSLFVRKPGFIARYSKDQWSINWCFYPECSEHVYRNKKKYPAPVFRSRATLKFY